MSSTSQLNMLINLANIDNDLTEDERNLIYMVGKANGIAENQIDEMLECPEELPDLSTLNEEEKFEHLFSVVQLMKIDKEIYLSEIKYCEDIAVKLGYQKTVISDLSSKIYSDTSITSNKESLKAVVKKYEN